MGRVNPKRMRVGVFRKLGDKSLHLNNKPPGHVNIDGKNLKSIKMNKIF